MTEWLAAIGEEGTHGCFFYQSEDQYIEIASHYFQVPLTHPKERCLWILPPQWNAPFIQHRLQPNVSTDLKPAIQNSKLVLSPWRDWFENGAGFSVQELMQKGKKFITHTMEMGYERLWLLTHALPASSPYWKQFLELEQRLEKSIQDKPVISLCGYRLTDCPAEMIPQVTNTHQISLIRNGSLWQPIRRTRGMAKSA